MCQNCIHKIEGRLSLKQHVHAEPCPKTSAPEELATAAVEVKFFGEELDLMESAACALVLGQGSAWTCCLRDSLPSIL